MNVSPEALDTWQRALHKARLRSPASFDQWFSSVQFDGLSDDGVLGLTARDEFVRDWVKTHFLPAMIGDLETASLASSSRRVAGSSYAEQEEADVEGSASMSCAGSVAGAASSGASSSFASSASTPAIRVDWRISSQLSEPIGTLPVAGGAANGNAGSEYPSAPRTIPPPARSSSPSSPPPSGPRTVVANGNYAQGASSYGGAAQMEASAGRDGRDSEPPRSSRRSPPGDGSGSARPPARAVGGLK